MSEENVELVRSALAAFNAGGTEALRPFLGPDPVLYPAPEWVEAREYHGLEGLEYLVSVFDDNFDEWGWEVHDVRDAGDRVVALVEHGGKLKESGAPISQPMGIVYGAIRDRRIGEARFFQSWDEALKEVGLTD
jgi:ketosteroid isomerase-like protein